MAVEKKKQSESIVILFKGGRLASWYELSQDEQHDYAHQHVELMLSVAREHRMMRLEGFHLISPQADWHRAWVIEFPTLKGTEAWIDAEVSTPHGIYAQKTMHLARKWSPEYFASWVTMETA